MTTTHGTKVLPQICPRANGRDDELKASRDRIRLLTVAPHRFVMIDGEGPPVAEAFEARIPGLYGVAYPIRFALKRRGVEGKVGPLESIWWTTDGETDLDAVFAADRGTWRWTLMIGAPDEATDAEIAEHLEAGRAKLTPELAGSLYVQPFDEGPAAQLLHVGPYAEERPTIERLHEQIVAAGLRPRGRHHELYVGDPRRSAPERLRTLIRQPVAVRATGWRSQTRAGPPVGRTSINPAPSCDRGSTASAISLPASRYGTRSVLITRSYRSGSSMSLA